MTDLTPWPSDVPPPRAAPPVERERRPALSAAAPSRNDPAYLRGLLGEAIAHARQLKVAFVLVLLNLLDSRRFDAPASPAAERLVLAAALRQRLPALYLDALRHHHFSCPVRGALWCYVTAAGELGALDGGPALGAKRIAGAYDLAGVAGVEDLDAALDEVLALDPIEDEGIAAAGEVLADARRRRDAQAHCAAARALRLRLDDAAREVDID